MKRIAYVYRAYSQGELQYVGCTVDLWIRVKQHRRYSWWSVNVDKVRAEIHPDKVAGLQAETEAIRSELPAWNLRDLEVLLLPTWDEQQFEAYLRRWLIHNENTRRWYKDRLDAKPEGCSASKFERLLKRYRLHNGVQFDLGLLVDVESTWRNLPRNDQREWWKAG